MADKIYQKQNGQLVEVNVGGGVGNSVEFIESTQAGTTGNWTGVSKDSALYHGKHIMYWLQKSGSGDAYLNLTLADGTQTGAKAVYFNGGANHVTTHFPAGSVIGLTYIHVPDGTAAQQAGYWRNDSDYYTGNNMNRLQNSNVLPCAKALVAGDMAGWNGTGYVPIKAGETVDISYPILLSLSATAAGATSTQLWYAYESKNIRSMSGMASKSVTANKMVYIIGTLDGTQFTIGADVLTTTEPSTEDGKVYIPVGVSYSTYQLYFCSMRPFFAFRNGKFGPLEPDLSGYAKTADLPTAFSGATASAAGSAGLVPAPAAGDGEKFLKGDGTWAAAPTGSGGGYTLPPATGSSLGGVIVGGGLEVTSGGTLSVSSAYVTSSAAQDIASAIVTSGGYVTSSYVASATVASAGKATSATTVNGHTVSANVPADALFTDTTYSLGTAALVSAGTDAESRVWRANTLSAALVTTQTDQDVSGAKTFKAKITAPNLELSGGTTNGGYIDFHYGQSTADYTVRLIESTSGTLSLKGDYDVSGSISITNDSDTGMWNDESSFSRGNAVSGSAKLKSYMHRDKSGAWLGGFSHQYSTTGLCFLQLRNYANVASSPLAQEVRLETNTSGTTQYFYATGTGCTLGKNTSNRWAQVIATNTSITTSDERHKDEIAPVPDAVLDAWEDVHWAQFKFKDAMLEKGGAARLHTGLIAQRVKAAFDARGLDAARYGLLCYDEWEEEPEVLDERGDIIAHGTPAGNMYSLRYEEALAMEAACQRRRADRAEARLDALERRLAALEAKLAGGNA